MICVGGCRFLYQLAADPRMGRRLAAVAPVAGLPHNGETRVRFAYLKPSAAGGQYEFSKRQWWVDWEPTLPLEVVPAPLEMCCGRGHS